MISDSKLNVLHVNLSIKNFVYLFFGKKFVSCHIWMLPLRFRRVSVRAILHTIHLLSQLSRSFPATDEEDVTDCSCESFLSVFWC